MAERMSVSRVLVAIIPDDEFEAVSLALIGSELADLKQALGRDCVGSISCGGGVFGYSDGERRCQEHSPNYLASALAMALGWRPMPGDYLAGPVLLCGLDEGTGENADLPHLVALYLLSEHSVVCSREIVDRLSAEFGFATVRVPKGDPALN
jgi:hypothetical protein